MIQVTHIISIQENSTGVIFSGAENHLFTLANAQLRFGLDVEIIFLIHRNGAVIQNKIKELRALGIKVIDQEVPAGDKYRALRSILPLIKLLAYRKNRVIHTHLDQSDLAGKIAAWIVGCKYIVSTFHNDEPYYKTFLWKIRLKFLEILSKKEIVISKAIYSQLVREVGLASQKIELIYYGVEPPKCNRSKEEIRKSLNIPPEKFVVGFVGRLTPQKNIPTFINAMEKIPDILAVIVGDGELRNDLEKQVRSQNIKNITFLGHQPNGGEIISCLDVLCLPSLWEGFGLVILEAMLQKVPVVGSQAGAIPEILGNNLYGYLFRPDDYESLAQKIWFVSQSQSEIKALVEKSYKYATENFTAEKMTLKTVEVYKKILSAQ